MSGASAHPDEARRLRSLRALGVLDSPPEERFDRLTRLAKRLFDVPIALVSLVDADRQWFKARVGLDAPETSRESSFCAHAILDDEVMVVPDAADDARFQTNPLVVGAPNIRFYAGCPVMGPDGHPLGTLCVIGHEPREVQDDEADLLRDLAGMVEEELQALSLATVDDLTGLTNRRGFDSIARHALAFCRRAERPATLLLFDLDDFKQVNDTRGHLAGDAVLQRFGVGLTSCFRDSDVVARWGGDEFAVLLGGAGSADADRPLGLLEELLAAGAEGPAIPFTVGRAEYDVERHPTVGDLVAEADRDLYDGKQAHTP